MKVIFRPSALEAENFAEQLIHLESPQDHRKTKKTKNKDLHHLTEDQTLRGVAKVNATETQAGA